MPIIRPTKDEVLTYFKLNFDGVETEDDAKEIHYQRNLLQQSEVSYVQVITGGFRQVTEAKSAFHRLDLDGGSSNADNSKWVSTDGKAEYVFRYDFDLGKFEFVDSSLNQGTYNFEPEADGKRNHMVADVEPWILWGNSDDDAIEWTTEERATAFSNSLYDAVSNYFSDSESPEKTKIGSKQKDTWIGKSQSFLYNGKGNEDTVSYGNSNTAVTANLRMKLGFDGHARGDNYKSIENLSGSVFGDILVGDNKNNVLIGEQGNDWLIGAGGNDTLYGGEGNDVLRGGAGDDYLVAIDTNDTVNGGKGSDWLWSDMQSIDLSNSSFKSVENIEMKAFEKGMDSVAYDAVGNNRSNKIFGNDNRNAIEGKFGDDVIKGRGEYDHLLGNGGSDTIFGGSGNDTINGGLGADILVGGEDKDVFFGTLRELKGDTIRDLSIGDSITLVGQVFDIDDVSIVRNKLKIELSNGNSFTIDGKLPVGAHFSVGSDAELGGTKISLIPEPAFYLLHSYNGMPDRGLLRFNSPSDYEVLNADAFGSGMTVGPNGTIVVGATDRVNYSEIIPGYSYSGNIHSIATFEYDFEGQLLSRDEYVVNFGYQGGLLAFDYVPSYGFVGTQSLIWEERPTGIIGYSGIELSNGLAGSFKNISGNHVGMIEFGSEKISSGRLIDTAVDSKGNIWGVSLPSYVPTLVKFGSSGNIVKEIKLGLSKGYEVELSGIAFTTDDVIFGVGREKDRYGWNLYEIDKRTGDVVDHGNVSWGFEPGYGDILITSDAEYMRELWSTAYGKDSTSTAFDEQIVDASELVMSNDFWEDTIV